MKILIDGKETCFSKIEFVDLMPHDQADPHYFNLTITHDEEMVAITGGRVRRLMPDDRLETVAAGGQSLAIHMGVDGMLVNAHDAGQSEASDTPVELVLPHDPRSPISIAAEAYREARSRM